MSGESIADCGLRIAAFKRLQLACDPGSCNPLGRVYDDRVKSAAAFEHESVSLRQ